MPGDRPCQFAVGPCFSRNRFSLMTQPSTLQDFPLAAGMQAIKDSLSFTDFIAFYRHLQDDLPQNSPETRHRYASLIVRWFFPDHELESLLARAWQAYGDDYLLVELIRIAVLEIEPVVARFVTELVQPLLPGDNIDSVAIRDYVTTVYGAHKQNSHKRLLTTANALGFIEHRASGWVVAAVRPPADGLLILLHARLAPTPRIVRLSDLLGDPFWRYLGLRQSDQVRRILHDADAAGLLARYSTVDQLEQVTTRYTLEYYLSRALRLRPS
jgi:hypothetical protein